MTITPHPEHVAAVLEHAGFALGEAEADWLADVLVTSWTRNADAPARSQSAFACVELVYAAAMSRRHGDPALAQHLLLLAEALALSWQAELQASTTVVPDDASTA